MIRLLFSRENLSQVDSIEFENFEFTKKLFAEKAFKTRPQGRQRVKMQRKHNKAIYFLKNSYFTLMWFHDIFSLQLNKHETAPNFSQLTQNLTSDCLLI